MNGKLSEMLEKANLYKKLIQTTLTEIKKTKTNLNKLKWKQIQQPWMYFWMSEIVTILN
jgi:hypothetical protein